MRVLVLGAEGFLGAAAANLLERNGHDVARAGRVERPGLVRVDISDRALMGGLSIETDVVVNCAARVPSSPSTLADHEAMFQVNAIGASRVAEWAARTRAKRLIHCSTLAVVARPWPVPLTETSPSGTGGPVAAYAASKLAGEQVAAAIAQAGGVSFTVLRFSALYGEAMKWVGVLPAFVDAALAGRRLAAAAGAHADFLHVDDAARIVAAAVECEAPGVINAASGVETGIVSLAEAALAACGRTSDEIDVTPSATAHAVVDVSRARDLLGFGPRVSVREGVERLVAARRAGR